MSELDLLYAGQLQAVLVRSDGTQTHDFDTSEVVVLAGSFNPLHEGHRMMLDVASKMTGRQGVFEISITNVDKPELPPEELASRLAQFHQLADVAITRAPLFSDKAKALPGAWFVIGYDTATRLVDDKYYPPRDEHFGVAGEAETHLSQLQVNGVKFLVAGRIAADGRFKGLGNLTIPNSLEEMFIEIPESEFRADVSSTAIRSGQTR